MLKHLKELDLKQQQANKQVIEEIAHDLRCCSLTMMMAQACLVPVENSGKIIK